MAGGEVFMCGMRKKILGLGLKPLDFAALAFVLSVGVFLAVDAVSAPPVFVSVAAAGRQFEFDLAEDGIHEVEGKLGTTKFELKNGRVRILDSPCPNKTCVSQGFSDSIVCLPNRVSIQVVRSQKGAGEFDVISK